MRSIKELLQLMLDNQHMFVFGLCHWVDCLFSNGLIDITEYFRLKYYIQDNRPIGSGFPYYWNIRDIKPRIYWINEHIKLNS